MRRLFVVGRLKDVIVVRGRNIHPEDVEEILAGAGASPPPPPRAYRIRRLAAVAVQVPGRAAGEGDTEELGVIVETDIAPAARAGAPPPDVFDRHAAEIRQRVDASLRVGVAVVSFVGRDVLPRTTSGKVKRRAAGALMRRVLAGAPGDACGVLHSEPLALFGDRAPPGRHFEPLLECLRSGREAAGGRAALVDIAARCVLGLIASIQRREGPSPSAPIGAAARVPLRDLGLDSSQLVALQSAIDASGVIVTDVDVIGTALGGSRALGDGGTVRWLAREVVAQALRLEEFRAGGPWPGEIDDVHRGGSVDRSAEGAPPPAGAVPAWQVAVARALLLLALCVWLSASWSEMARVRGIDWYRQTPADYFETFGQRRFGMYLRRHPLYAAVFGGAARHMDASHPRFHEFVGALPVFLSTAALLACVRAIERPLIGTARGLAAAPAVGGAVGIGVASRHPGPR